MKTIILIVLVFAILFSGFVTDIILTGYNIGKSKQKDKGTDDRN